MPLWAFSLSLLHQLRQWVCLSGILLWLVWSLPFHPNWISVTLSYQDEQTFLATSAKRGEESVWRYAQFKETCPIFSSLFPWQPKHQPNRVLKAPVNFQGWVVKTLSSCPPTADECREPVAPGVHFSLVEVVCACKDAAESIHCHTDEEGIPSSSTHRQLSLETNLHSILVNLVLLLF